MSVGTPSSVPSDPGGGGGEWLVDEQATEATVPRSQARPLTFVKAVFARVLYDFVVYMYHVQDLPGGIDTKLTLNRSSVGDTIS